MSNPDSPTDESPQTLITRRAIEDPDFRERLIEDPRSTIAKPPAKTSQTTSKSSSSKTDPRPSTSCSPAPTSIYPRRT